jgi:hypothetical protein
MTTSKKSVRIVAQQATATLSKGQKTFNTLVEKIAKQRDVLAQWQVAAEACKTKVASEFQPLYREFQAQQVVFAWALDQKLDKPGLTKTERETLEMVILSMVEHLLGETDDESLKPLYAKYSGGDFDAEEEAALAEAQEEDAHFKAAMEAVYGAPTEDDPEGAVPQTPEELLQKLFAQMGNQPPRKPTAKQQAKQKAEDDQTSLSIREVYRKLASALHPDREPDPAERERKTGLMQRVNLAYDKKDLLKLLELQLELEHIDASTIASLSEDRLKHYNKVLKEQLRELEAEVLSVQMPLRAGFQMHPYEALTLPSVMPRIHADVARLQRNVAQVRADTAMLDDPKALKAWIKEYRRQHKAMQRQMDEEDGFPFF